MKAPGPVCEHCGFEETMCNAPHQLQIGTVLKEQYQIGKVLGQGGFGITYLGWDLYLDIPVAIKEYYPAGTVMREASVTMNVTDMTGDDGVRFRNNRERFLREAKMLARFSQVPEIVQIKNFFLANNTAYIVMEYVEGITLKQHVKNQGGKLSPEETFAVLGPIIQTLAKVHKTGIIHRDISPDNIMMVSGGAKLLDFGAVRTVSGEAGKELTKSTEAILKQGYAPIEQYQKKGAMGPWTDVYALCATIYYSLTGEVPPDAPARMLEYENMDIEGIPGLTDAQRAALNHGLELRADRRTPSMEELYRELFVKQPKPEPKPEEDEKPEPKAAPRTEIKAEAKPAPRTLVEPEEKPRTEGKPAPRQEKKQEPRQKPTRGKLAVILAAAGAVLALVVAVVIGMSRQAPDGLTGADTSLGDSENIVSGDCGMTATWHLNLDTGVMEIRGLTMNDFYLDSYDEELRRDKVARPWEEYTDIITEVTFEDTLYHIGTASFAHCQNLTKVTFGKNVREIGGDAFWNTALTEVELPDTLMEIGYNAFEHTLLREVTIPLFVDVIEACAFADCPDLETVNIMGLTRWNYDTWRDWPVFCRENGSVENLTLRGPEGGIVEDYAGIIGCRFESNGKTVTFEGQGDFSAYPGDVDGHWYFDRESNFLKIEGEMPTGMLGEWEIHREIYNNEKIDPQRKKDLPLAPWNSYRDEIYVASIGEGVTRICDNAFAWCHNLTDVSFPSTLKSIGFQSFLSTNVDQIILPDSVTEISGFAFNYCENLWMARLPIGLAELEQGVFNACPKLEAVYVGNRTRFYEAVHSGYPVTPFNNEPSADGHLDETKIPENLVLYTPQTDLGASESAVKKFAEKYNIRYDERIFGHENAEVFGAANFGGSDIYWALEDGVLNLIGSGATPFFRSGNQDRNAWHTLQSADLTWSTEAPWYPYRNEIHTAILDKNITIMNRGILCDMPNLKNVDLGNVQWMYEGAIDNCGITTIDLPDTLTHVHKGAIQDCIDLETIHVNNGSEKMDHGAFQGCDNLKALYFWSGTENIWASFDLFEGNVPRGLTIYGHEGSTAQQYADRSGIPFEKLN